MCSFYTSKTLLMSLQLFHHINLAISARSDSKRCDLDGYYFSRFGKVPSQWSRENISSLLESTHTTITPFVGSNPGNGDVLEALIELDPGRDGRDLPPSTSVSLFYADKNVAQYPLDRTIWVPEHIHPLFRGSISDSNFLGAFSDLHNIRPTHPALHESIRETKYFGLCPSCPTNDFTETIHHDACICGDYFQPPEASRGPIARALLYMQLRYQELEISNCHLEHLLAWHKNYPPTSQEQSRNLHICNEWQGNRNPFVDFPSLAFTMEVQEADCIGAAWGENSNDLEDHLDNIFGESRQREQAIFQKPSQNSEIALGDRAEVQGEVFEEGIMDSLLRPSNPEVQSCAEMILGDVYFYVLQAEPIPRIGILPLIDLPMGLTLYLSNTLSFHTPGNLNIEIADDYPDPPLIRLTLEKEITQGNPFGFGKNLLFGFDWEVMTEPLSVRGNAFGGDEFFVFCLDEQQQIRLLSAITTNGRFRENRVEREIESNGFGQTVLPEPRNYYAYNGPHFAKNDPYQRALMNPSNWLGINDGIIQNEGSDGLDSTLPGGNEGKNDQFAQEGLNDVDTSGATASVSMLDFRIRWMEALIGVTITNVISLVLFE